MKNLRKMIVGVGVLLLSTGLFAQDWFVCVGSYSSHANAEELVSSLEKKGVSTFIYEFTKDNGSILYRVLVDDAFTSRDAARNSRDKLEKSSAITSLRITGLWICEAEKVEKPIHIETITQILEKPYSNVKICLEWSDKSIDLDSTLINSVLQIDYENAEEGGIILSYDEDAEYAPETISIADLDEADTYSYYVEEFGNFDEESKSLSNSGAVVKVYVNGECLEIFTITPEQEGTTWHVFDIVNGGDFISVNQVSNEYVGE